MVNDRQQVSDDLARLTQQMRTAARELAPTQPAASSKLRSALEGMDENDLGTRMQRSSDQLRSGDFSDPAETALTSDLQKLGRQVGDAARALGSAQHASEDAALNRAMDDLSRLRDQLAGLGGRPNSNPSPSSSQGQPGGQQSQAASSLARAIRSGGATAAVKAGQAGQGGQDGQGGQGGQAAGQADGQQAGKAGSRRWRSGRQSGRRRGGIAIAAPCLATSTPATLASPARPWRPNKVPTRPTPSARSSRD